MSLIGNAFVVMFIQLIINHVVIVHIVVPGSPLEIFILNPLIRHGKLDYVFSSHTSNLITEQK